MKAIRWLLKLVLVMITLPLILAVWLAKWFVVFLHVKPETEKKRRGRRKKSEIEAEQKEN